MRAQLHRRVEPLLAALARVPATDLPTSLRALATTTFAFAAATTPDARSLASGAVAGRAAQRPIAPPYRLHLRQFALTEAMFTACSSGAEARGAAAAFLAPLNGYVPVTFVGNFPMEASD